MVLRRLSHVLFTLIVGPLRYDACVSCRSYWSGVGPRGVYKDGIRSATSSNMFGAVTDSDDVVADQVWHVTQQCAKELTTMLNVLTDGEDV